MAYRFHNKVWLGSVILTTAMTLPSLCLGNDVSLIERSPFIPQDWNPPNSSQATNNRQPLQSAATLEFKGVYQIRGDYYFNVYDKRTTKSQWVPLNLTDGDYRITYFDPNENAITLDYEGKEIVLTMNAPDNKPIPVVGAATGQPTTRPAVRPTNPRRVVRPSSRSNQSNSRRRVIRRP